MFPPHWIILGENEYKKTSPVERDRERLEIASSNFASLISQTKNCLLELAPFYKK